MEREGFVFTACSFILSFLAGCGEEQYRVPCCTHKGAGVQERHQGRAGVLPRRFSLFTSASFGTDQLAEEPCGFLDPEGLQWGESPQPFTAPLLVCVNSGPASQETQVGSFFQRGFLNYFIVSKPDGSSLSLFSQG